MFLQAFEIKFQFPISILFVRYKCCEENVLLRNIIYTKSYISCSHLRREITFPIPSASYTKIKHRNPYWMGGMNAYILYAMWSYIFV